MNNKESLRNTAIRSGASMLKSSPYNPIPKTTNYNDINFQRGLTALNDSVMKNPTAEEGSASRSAAAANALGRANAQAASYQAQLDALNSNAADAKQNNWIQYMKAVKALPQQMANSGINGGTTESSLVRLNSAYGSANNSVDKDVMPERTNLEMQLKAARATADAAKKRAASSGGADYITNAYGNILNNSQQAELNDIIRGMAALGYTDAQIQTALQKAGF